MKVVKSVALAAVLLLAVGCQQKAEDGVRIDLSVEPSPPKVGKASVTLDVRDADGKPVEGATLKLEGNMAHAGMKPVFADAREQKAGRYQADLEFTMGGDWFILVEGRRADGSRFQQKIDVKGVKAD